MPKICPIEQEKEFYSFLLSELTFDDIQKDLPRLARKQLADIFDKLSIRKTEFNWLMLSLAEILSNLLKHPEVSPTFVKVTFSVASPTEIMLVISDDASPFHDFEEKMKASLELVNKKKLDESGRGLALINKAHPDHCYSTKDKSSDGLNHFAIWFPERSPEHLEQIEATVSKLLTVVTNIDTLSVLKPKLVIVDDDKVVRFLLEEILQENYELFVFEHAREALTKIPELKPDMIISDLNMPDMDGVELRRSLNDLPEGAMIPFIFLSGDEKAATRDYINDLGIDDYLVKPVKKKKLISVIERLLLRSKQIKNDIQGRVQNNITKVLSPSLPTNILNWNCEVRHANAKVGGGDFLFHSEDEDQATLILSDVMGHGLEAKFFAYAFAGYLRSVFHMIEDKSAPERILEKFSTAINNDQIFESTIITCLGLRILTDGLISFSVAAHPKPYILTKEGYERVDIGGPLPGLMGDNEYTSRTYQLKKGDRVVLFTDGLIEDPSDIEAQNENEKKIIEKALSLKDEKINETMDLLWEFHYEKIRQKQVLDDTTLIMLEYGGAD